MMADAVTALRRAHGAFGGQGLRRGAGPDLRLQPARDAGAGRQSIRGSALPSCSAPAGRASPPSPPITARSSPMPPSPASTPSARAANRARSHARRAERRRLPAPRSGADEQGPEPAADRGAARRQDRRSADPRCRRCARPARPISPRWPRCRRTAATASTRSRSTSWVVKARRRRCGIALSELSTRSPT